MRAVATMAAVLLMLLVFLLLIGSASFINIWHYGIGNGQQLETHLLVAQQIRTNSACD